MTDRQIFYSDNGSLFYFDDNGKKQPIKFRGGFGGGSSGLSRASILALIEEFGGGAEYEFVGSVDFNDINTNAGSSSFDLGSFSYDGKAITSFLLKSISTFGAVDVNVVQVGLKDINSATSLGSGSPLLTTGDVQVLNTVGGYQSSGANYTISVIYAGKGSFSIGNTTGKIEVYKLTTPIP